MPCMFDSDSITECLPSHAMHTVGFDDLLVAFWGIDQASQFLYLVIAYLDMHTIQRCLCLDCDSTQIAEIALLDHIDERSLIDRLTKDINYPLSVKAIRSRSDAQDKCIR